MFCSTATTVAMLQNAWSGHNPDTPRADCRSLGERGGMMSDDVICGVRLSYIAVFLPEGQRQGGNRWLRSLRDRHHLCQCVGSLQPVKGALRRYAPMTGFHSKGRSHWSLASPSCPLNMATIRRCTSPSTLTNVLLTNAA